MRSWGNDMARNYDLGEQGMLLRPGKNTQGPCLGQVGLHGPQRGLYFDYEKSLRGFEQRSEMM